MDTPSGASTSKQVKESIAEIPDLEYIEIDNSTNENQPHFGVIDMLCVLDTNTRQEDLTTPIDKDIQIHFNNSISGITNSISSFTPIPTDPLLQERKPPDPGDQNKGEGRRNEFRGSEAKCRGTRETDQLGGAVVRTRERSSSPSHFRLVDRTTLVDHRAKLGDNRPHPLHSVQMASLRSTEDNHQRIRIIVDIKGTNLPTFPSMDLIRILFWNCRGAGNNKFKRNLVEIIKTHKPEILVLMETKVAFSTMSEFFNRLGFTASSTIDPVSRVGGIWIVWDTSQVNVRASTVSPQVIHATVHKEDYEEWVLDVVYASPNPNLRDQLWHDLEDVADTMQQPWLVTGDFNDYANQRERRSFSANHNTSRTQKFLDRVNRCNLIDLGSSGPRLTRTNNRQRLANTMKRLDRALCNAEWRTMFPKATIRVLPRTYSDHSPLVVYKQGMHTLNPRNRPFRFEATWMSHPKLINVIKSSWHNMNNHLLDSTADFTNKVTEWNKEVFGNIFKRKRRLLARIEGTQKALVENFTHSLQNLEHMLIKDYNETLLQEEMLWFQKSRSKHITLRDKNTKYFHISTLSKRRKLKINAHKNDEGTWISDTEGVKNIILDYFQNLFSKSVTQQLDHWKNNTPAKFSKEDNNGFLKPLSNLEILYAISLKNIRNYVHEIDEAYHSVLHLRPYQHRLIH
ncbi:hypothetical protein ACSBR1_033489 [Camellia fascicularis]